MGKADHAVDEAMRLVEESIKTKQKGDFVGAEALLDRALSVNPNHQAAHFELAYIYYISDRRLESVKMLHRLLSLYPSDERAKRQLATSAGLLGLRQQMVDAINALQPSADSVSFAARTMQFASFVAAFPLTDTLARLAKLEALRTYHTTNTLSEAILEAVRARRPFSFVRLGDGEGTHLKIDLADEAKYSSVYEHTRQVFRDIWFKGALGEVDAFDSLSDEFRSVIEDCDILGIPFEPWIRHEFRIGSITGITALTNIVRFLDYKQVKPEFYKGFCWQNIHFALAQSLCFEDLFREKVRFGLISGHRNLPDAIRQKFGVSIDYNFKIPAEGAYKGLLGDQDDAREHHPEVFRNIRQSLQKADLCNHVFLVAAGYLGKFYCYDIKRSGGIAVDIGSIADGWMGRHTRPGMENVRML